MRRRRFIATGAGVGVGLLAGCSGSNDSGGSDGTSGDGTSTDGTGDGDTTMDDGGAVGAFRLLISDQPAAIDDFDSLDVSFSRTRIFHAGEDETETATESDETETEATETATAEATETETVEATESETEEMDDEDEAAEDETEDDESMDNEDGDDTNGFVVRELGGATVDLTEVVGDKAISVLDDELEEGRYSKIELYAESVDGVVDGESVDVKIPSGKLQITKSFEVVAGESVDFVFDINVVKKGNGGYNLLPVISKSGVAGKDVEVEEVGKGSDNESDDADEETEVETTEIDGTDRDPMTESDRRGNETTADE